jgi:hypothetical protein
MKYTDEQIKGLITVAQSYNIPEFKVPFSLLVLQEMHRALKMLSNQEATHLVIGGAALSMLVNNDQIHDMLQPTTGWDEAQLGFVGSLWGADMITDAFIPPEQRDVKRSTMVCWIAYVPEIENYGIAADLR